MVRRRRDRDEEPAPRRKKGKRSSSGSSSGKFKYRRRSKQQTQKRANQSGGNFDSIFGADFTLAKFGEGDHRFRILPPTWDDPEHYGVDVFIHSSVGPDDQSYLCKQRMAAYLPEGMSSHCVICEEQRRANREGDTEFADKIKAYRKVVTWVIDRANEDAGPVINGMPALKMDKEIASRSIDKETGEYLEVDHPEDGYDILFSKEGKGKKTQYSGVDIARRSTPLSDDEDQANEWLEYISEHPLTSIFNFYEDEHILAQLSGSGSSKDEDDDEEDDEGPRTRKSRKTSKKRSRVEEDDDEDDEDEDEDEEEEERPRKKARSRRIDDEDEDLDDDDEEDDEDDDEDDDEEDEEPAPRRKSSKKGKTSKKRSRIDDDEDDEEDDEEEDEEPTPRRKSRKTSKKRSRVEEDDEDDDDDDDEDEEEERPRKKAKGRGGVREKAAAAARSKRRR